MEINISMLFLYTVRDCLKCIFWLKKRHEKKVNIDGAVFRWRLSNSPKFFDQMRRSIFLWKKWILTRRRLRQHFAPFQVKSSERNMKHFFGIKLKNIVRKNIGIIKEEIKVKEKEMQHLTVENAKKSK